MAPGYAAGLVTIPVSRHALCADGERPRLSFRLQLGFGVQDAQLGSIEQLDTSPRYHARLAFEPAVVGEVKALLLRYWDPDGVLSAAARELESRDLAQARSIADYAMAVCGMLAAGGTEADVSGFLRGEEAKLLGEPRSTGHTRMPLARACW
jgi:hypothetical protein